MRAQPSDAFDLSPDEIPPRPYAPTSAVLMLPAGLPMSVTQLLGPSTAPDDDRDKQRGLEGGALLYGHRSRDGGPDIVSGIVVPEQIRNKRNYRISHAGIDAASDATREHGWVVLAQVHTHPGRSVEHSWFDDRNAISIRALSLVVPHYGSDPAQWHDGVGTHEFQIDWWHLLTTEQARTRVVVVDAPLVTIDLRA